jgi:hypothetical protein
MFFKSSRQQRLSQSDGRPRLIYGHTQNQERGKYILSLDKVPQSHACSFDSLMKINASHGGRLVKLSPKLCILSRCRGINFLSFFIAVLPCTSRMHHQVLESRLKPIDVIISFPLKNSVFFSSHCIPIELQAWNA